VNTCILQVDGGLRRRWQCFIFSGICHLWTPCIWSSILCEELQCHCEVGNIHYLYMMSLSHQTRNWCSWLYFKNKFLYLVANLLTWNNICCTIIPSIGLNHTRAFQQHSKNGFIGRSIAEETRLCFIARLLFMASFKNLRHPAHHIHLLWPSPFSLHECTYTCLLFG